MIIVLLFAVLFIFIFFMQREDIFSTIANTWLAFMLGAWLSIEALSIFSIWNKVTVFIFWGIVLAVFWMLNIRTNAFSKNVAFAVKVKAILNRHKIAFAILFIFYNVILLMALIRQQSNLDSFIYHLPRIMHWIQNGSVKYYGAGSELQIRYPSMAEYMVAQVLILQNTSRLANLVQTTSYILSGVMVYGIGRKIGTSKVSAYTSMWMFYLVPMALGQAFSTQTDNIACLVLLIYIYFILDYILAAEIKMCKRDVINTSKIALCVSLGYLCKPTICFAMVIFFVWMVIRIVRAFDVKSWGTHILCGVIILIIILSPQYFRAQGFKSDYVRYINNESVNSKSENTDISDEQVSDAEKTAMASALNTIMPDSFNVVNGIKNPRAFIMTSIMNMGRNSFSAYYEDWNEDLVANVNKIGNALDYDTQYFVPQFGKGFWDYDTASAPVLMATFMLAILFMLLRVSKTNSIQNCFAASTFLSLIIQCGLMGFTHFRTRYLIGVMALMCITVGVSLSHIIFERFEICLCTAGLALSMLGGAYTLRYQSEKSIKSLSCGRVHSYFLDNETYADSYSPIIEMINNYRCQNVGLYENNGYEYVFWRGPSDLQRLECVNVNNVYRIYEDKTFIPDCVVVDVKNTEEISDEISVHDVEYKCDYVTDVNNRLVALYIKNIN